MQQDRRRDRRHRPRCSDLRDAGDLLWRIQSWLLGIASTDSGASHQVPLRIARLFELGGVPETDLAGGHWLAFSGNPVGGHRLFRDANADQPGQVASGRRMTGPEGVP